MNVTFLLCLPLISHSVHRSSCESSLRIVEQDAHLLPMTDIVPPGWKIFLGTIDDDEVCVFDDGQ